MNDQPNTPRSIPPRSKDDGRGHKFNVSELLYVLDGVSVSAKWKDRPQLQPEDGTMLRPEKLPKEVPQGEAVLRKWVEDHAESTTNPTGEHPLPKWREDIQHLDDPKLRSVASIVLGVALLRQQSRSAPRTALDPTPPETIELMWELVRTGLTSGHLELTPNRSAQGFVAVPLFSRIHNDDLSELCRFHVWRTDGERGDPEIAIHAHQPWTRSWVLGGKGVDHSYSYKVLDETKPEEAAQANASLYSISWLGDPKDKPTHEYKTFQTSSTIYNKHTLIKWKDERQEAHTQNMSYTIRADNYHTTQVPAEELHATLFYFDARYGFVGSAGVIGPIIGEHFTTIRHCNGVKSIDLASLAEGLRRYDIHMDEARQYADLGDWESAIRAVKDAIWLCSSPDSSLAKEPQYLPIALAEVGHISRRLGRYEEAVSDLQGLLTGAEALGDEESEVEESDKSSETEASEGSSETVVSEAQSETAASKSPHVKVVTTGSLGSNVDIVVEVVEPDEVKEASKLVGTVVGPEVEPGPEPQQPEARRPSRRLFRAEIYGELGALYRDLGRLGEAKRAFEAQYALSEEVGWRRGMCSAIGDLGTVNYQLWQASKNAETLDQAIKQLQGSIERTGPLKEFNGKRVADWRRLVAWEAIWLGRLALCFAARGNIEHAILAARASSERPKASGDKATEAISLHLSDQLLQFASLREKVPSGLTWTGADLLASTLSREPFTEHRRYLAELVKECDVPFDAADEDGYRALDYAVLNSDPATERLVLEGLRHTHSEDQIALRRTEASLKKGTRDLFRGVLRSAILESEQCDVLHRVRAAYADALGQDDARRAMFDGLKYVRYGDFKMVGSLPRSTDGWTREFDPKKVGEVDFVVFLSYSRSHKSTGESSPDDAKHTKYQRMLEALRVFLNENPHVNPDRLGVWVDYACIDQTSPTVGMNALPFSLMQCNAVISIVDQKLCDTQLSDNTNEQSYYSQAWCSAEASMAQTLRRVRGLSSWYEYSHTGSLTEGPDDLNVNVGKTLSYKEEISRVELLLRQCQSLCEPIGG